MGKANWTELAKLIDRDRISPILIIIAALLGALGAIGAWPYPHFAISGEGQNTLLGIAALSFIVGVILYFAPSTKTPFDPKKHKIMITSPESTVRTHNSLFDVEGTFEESLPPNHRAIILELLGQGKFRPRGFVDFDDRRKRWKANKIWGGGEPGVRMTIAVAIVGPSGVALTKYYQKVGRAYDYKDRPSIDDLPNDIYICHQRQIVTSVS